MLPKTERIRLVIQATHPRPSRIQMTFPNASLRNEIASEKKTWAASSFCIEYITKPIPTSHFFQKENQNKFADSPVFLTRPKEKKKKEKEQKRGKGRRKKMFVWLMILIRDRETTPNCEILNLSISQEVFSKEIKTIKTKPTATLSFFNRIQTKAKIELSQVQPTWM